MWGSWLLYFSLHVQAVLCLCIVPKCVPGPLTCGIPFKHTGLRAHSTIHIAVM